jgi:hypothetical protein
MNILSIVCVFIVSVTVVSSAKWACNRSDERKIDSLMAEIMTYGTRRKYPKNQDELKTYCDEHYRLILEVEDYKNECLKALSKQTISVILYSIKSLINQYCKKNSNNKKVEDLLSAASCANSATNEFNKCNIKYIDSLLAAQNTKEDRVKIAQMCCEYHKIFDCIQAQGIRVKGCTDKHLEISADYIKSHFSNVLDLMCGDYSESSDKCDSVPKLSKRRKNQRRTKSFVMPLVKLLKDLPEA